MKCTDAVHLSRLRYCYRYRGFNKGIFGQNIKKTNSCPTSNQINAILQQSFFSFLPQSRFHMRSLAHFDVGHNKASVSEFLSVVVNEKWQKQQQQHNLGFSKTLITNRWLGRSVYINHYFVMLGVSSNKSSTRLQPVSSHTRILQCTLVLQCSVTQQEATLTGSVASEPKRLEIWVFPLM